MSPTSACRWAGAASTAACSRRENDGVTFYFIDNEYYFKRSGLYGFYDDGERVAFFARAILEMLFYTDFEPDIINCNDWQTALTPRLPEPVLPPPG